MHHAALGSLGSVGTFAALIIDDRFGKVRLSLQHARTHTTQMGWMAPAPMRQITKNPERYDPWFADIMARKPGKVAAVAMANKTARMVWAVLTRNEPYRVRTI